MSKIISGKKIAQKIKEELKKDFSQFKKKVGFSIVYVGKDPVIDNFIRYKKRFGEDIGVEVTIHNFSKDIQEKVLIEEIKKIFADPKCDAIIIQLPLPNHINTQWILDTIPVGKDVDVLGTSTKEMSLVLDNFFLPPVTGAIIEVFKSKNYNFFYKKIVLVGNGNLVGKPFAEWLKSNGISFSVIDKQINETEKRKLLKESEIIISGVGIPGFITSDMIKDSVVLIDAGTSEVGKKLKGDIDPSCYEKASFYTPVPGGIGPITIAVLYQNILKSVKLNQNES